MQKHMKRLWLSSGKLQNQRLIGGQADLCSLGALAPLTGPDLTGIRIYIGQDYLLNLI